MHGIISPFIGLTTIKYQVKEPVVRVREAYQPCICIFCLEDEEWRGDGIRKRK